jgi:hypothetical protein
MITDPAADVLNDLVLVSLSAENLRYFIIEGAAKDWRVLCQIHLSAGKRAILYALPRWPFRCFHPFRAGALWSPYVHAG